MRIAHVVTYVSADGAFGGPVAVALAQTEELARRGHQVELLAGWDGRATLPATNVTHRLFPVRRIGPSFGGLVAPRLIAWLRAHARDHDVVHVHLARDLITLSAARIALVQGRRLVLQPHGMVMPDQRTKSRVVDRLATREILHRASTVFALTAEDGDGLAAVAGAPLPRLRMIPNGIPRQAVGPAAERTDPPVVMFLARLHPRKRVLTFAESARRMIEQGSDARFEVFGPDEGDLPALRNFISANGLTDRLVYRGALAQGMATTELRRAAVYVLPAVREVFPMSVLEALSVGTPVVLGEDCGIAPELRRRGAASVCDGSPAAIAAACTRLLSDAALRAQQTERGLESIQSWLGISTVVGRLEEAYQGAL